MDCTVCQYLKSELDRLERTHAEKSRAIQKTLKIGASRHEYNVHWVAEGRARLNMVSARFELNLHKQSKHKESHCL